MVSPLTPSNCDLRGLPFMPLDTVRLVDSDLVALTNGDEFKAAVILWCKSWTQLPAASLPNDDRILARLTSLSPEGWAAVKTGALRGFVECADGRLYHPVVAEKALEAWKHRQKQRAKAQKRWGIEAPELPLDMPRHKCGTPDAEPPAMQGTGTGTGKDREPSVLVGFSNPTTDDEMDFLKLAELAEASDPSPPRKPKKTKANPSGCVAFAEAWSDWPRKDRSAKARASALWDCHPAMPGEKLAAVKAYLAGPDARRDGAAYVKGLHLWLRDFLESWLETVAAKPMPIAPAAFAPSANDPEWFAAVVALAIEANPGRWSSYGHSITADTKTLTIRCGTGIAFERIGPDLMGYAASVNPDIRVIGPEPQKGRAR